jgi:hypothetical protein
LETQIVMNFSVKDETHPWREVLRKMLFVRRLEQSRFG